LGEVHDWAFLVLLLDDPVKHTVIILQVVLWGKDVF
jgi:hypothetical protein